MSATPSHGDAASPRRRIALALAAAGLLLGAAPAALAQAAWPTKPVRVIVPFTAGGSADALTRVVAEEMARLSGQPFVVENKPGAGATIGTAQVARAPADGYTLLTATPTFVIAQFAYPKLSYDIRRDFTPVGMILTTPLVLVTHPGLNVRNPREYVEAAKAKPGAVTYSSSGIGSVPHLAGELLKQEAKLDIVHVPFGGGAPALTSVVSGQVSSYFGTPIELAEFIKAGRITAVGATAARRIASMPDVPTFAEAGIANLEVTHFTGLVAAAGTPAPLVERMSALLQRALQSPAVREKIAQAGDLPAGTTQEAAQILTKEIARWSKVVQSANITMQ